MRKPNSRPYPLGIHLDVTNRLWQAAMGKSIPYTYLNRPHWLALSAIAELGDRCNLKMIVRHLNSEVSTVSRAIKFLEENNLITKSVDREDRRAKGLTMTSSGHQLLKELDTVAQSIREKLLLKVSDEQLDVFIEVLVSIRVQAIGILYGNSVPDNLLLPEDFYGAEK